MSKFRAAGKWRTQGPARANTGPSVRGKTISQPIPFPDDDEFPIRTPGTGLAIPLGPEGIDHPPRMRLSTPTEADTASHQTGIAVSDYTEPIMNSQPTSIPSQPSPEAQARSLQPSAVRNSMTSGPGGSSIGKPQRQKSSLKSVFGRLFGKKSKGGPSTSITQQDSGDSKAGLHRSDPTALSRTDKDSPSSQKRSASLPINEFNRALRSHSVVADTFIGVNPEIQTSTDLINAEEARRPRRATTPSRLWTPTRTPGYVDWTGLSPRPVSSHARGSKVNSHIETDAPIGTAVTLGSHPNRRSRSVGELRAAHETRPLERRRSDEIRYWRASYDPGPLSPMSSNKPEEPTVVEPESPREEEHHEPPQPFNFGPMGEMAGMKITQAASLETRVRRLEDRLLRIERGMTSKDHRNSKNLHLEEIPKRNSRRISNARSVSANRPNTNNSDISLPAHPRYRDPQPKHLQEPSSDTNQSRSSSYGHSRPSTVSTHNSYHPSFDTFSPDTFSPPEGGQVIIQDVARPLSTSTTIRGIPSSSPTMPKEGHLTAEHYMTLTNMILAEQAARQNLEALVNDLQQQLLTIRSSIHQPNSYHHMNMNMNNNPSSGALNLNEDTNTTGGFSSFEENDSSDDDGRYGHEDLDEVFQTPNEERGHFGDEIFGSGGNPGDGGDGSLKSAPRTLSLSQITMGRGVQQSVNF